MFAALEIGGEWYDMQRQHLTIETTPWNAPPDFLSALQETYTVIVLCCYAVALVLILIEKPKPEEPQMMNFQANEEHPYTMTHVMENGRLVATIYTRAEGIEIAFERDYEPGPLAVAPHLPASVHVPIASRRTRRWPEQCQPEQG